MLPYISNPDKNNGAGGAAGIGDLPNPAEESLPDMGEATPENVELPQIGVNDNTPPYEPVINGTSETPSGAVNRGEFSGAPSRTGI